MLRRFFVVGPAGLAVGKLFPAKGEPREKGEDKDDEPRPPVRGNKDEPVPQPVEVYKRNNDDLLIANTTVESALFSYAVPASWLIGDHGVRATINITYKNQSGSSTVNYTFRIKYGATTLLTVVLQPSSSATEWHAAVSAELMANNSDAAQELFVDLFGRKYGTSAEDATTELDLVFTIEMASAHANSWVLHRRSIVELV